eukprot:195301-Rhodomonas_salina.1
MHHSAATLIYHTHHARSRAVFLSLPCHSQPSILTLSRASFRTRASLLTCARRRRSGVGGGSEAAGSRHRASQQDGGSRQESRGGDPAES